MNIVKITSHVALLQKVLLKELERWISGWTCIAPMLAESWTLFAAASMSGVSQPPVIEASGSPTLFVGLGRINHFY